MHSAGGGARQVPGLVQVTREGLLFGVMTATVRPSELIGMRTCTLEEGLGPAPSPSAGAGDPEAKVRVCRTAMQKVANRDGRDFGWEMSSRGRYAKPADFPRDDGTSYRELRVRRWG
jgi:hypothetical protein